MFGIALGSCKLSFFLLFPLYASVYGTDCALRLSLTALAAIGTFSLTRCNTWCAPSLLNVPFMLFLLVNPFVILPWFILEAYRLALIWSQPLLLISEAVLVVNFFCSITRYFIDRMDDHPFSCKTFILSIAIMTYILSVRMFLMCLATASFTMKCILWSVLVLQLVIFVYAILVDNEDVAMVCLTSFSCLALTPYYVDREDVTSAAAITDLPSSGQYGGYESNSVLWLLLELPTMVYDRSNPSLRLAVLSTFVNYKFWLSLALRLLAVRYVLRHALSAIYGFFIDDEEVEESSDESQWPTSADITKMSVVLIYTQLVLCNTTTPSSCSPTNPGAVQWSRAMQSVAVGVYYVCNIVRNSESDLPLDAF